MIAGTDTIAAPATARGRAALSIIRVSGPDAISIAHKCFRGQDLRKVSSHTAHFGRIYTSSENTIDQVVATVFRAPASATGEDVVEISCHGGDFASQLILDTLLSSGARMADPGEFTLRAFLNGKIDLAQAEAVADIIHASSTAAHRVSVSQLEGRYSELLESLRLELLDLGAMLELELDFSEEDVQFADRDKLYALISGATRLLTELTESYRTGARIRDGITVIIAGRPNAGKSTLLNALLGKQRAIVSDIPGTTRDEIEDVKEIAGLPFRFLDTAGLRHTSDSIEAEGVRRAKHSMTNADIVLYVYDSAVGMEKGELQDVISTVGQDARIIVVANKSDLVTSKSVDVGDFAAYSISARDAQKDVEILSPLIEELVSQATDGVSTQDSSRIVTNRRHRDHLVKANASLQALLGGLDRGDSGDLLSIELRQALHELGAITGKITNEDILDGIFSRFCIGK